VRAPFAADPAPSRHAANSARHRLRKRRAERVYYLALNSELLIISMRKFVTCGARSDRRDERSPLPAAVGRRSFAQHTTTMFFPYFVGDVSDRCGFH
jgi:hypothetical protein